MPEKKTKQEVNENVVMNSDMELIAVCGLDCGPCDIRKILTWSQDPDKAQRIVEWFQREGWLKEDEGIDEVINKGMYCKGCKGDRSAHWSPDCKILTCCVDEKNYEFCYQCDDFPCKLLVEWANQNESYSLALNRLKDMKENYSSG